jgi:hypothetical protein
MHFAENLSAFPENSSAVSANPCAMTGSGPTGAKIGEAGAFCKRLLALLREAVGFPPGFTI